MHFERDTWELRGDGVSGLCKTVPEWVILPFFLLCRLTSNMYKSVNAYLSQSRETRTCKAQLYKFQSKLFYTQHGTELVPIFYHWCPILIHTSWYSKIWVLMCPFFKNLHLRENLARDCITSTASTVTNSVQNIFTRLRSCDKLTVATFNNNLA